VRSSLLVDIIVSERRKTAGELLLGQSHSNRGVDVQELGLETVELRDHPLDRQREGQPQEAVNDDPEGGGALPGHA